MWMWMWIWNVSQCIGLFHPFLLQDIVNEIQSSRAYLIIYIIITAVSTVSVMNDSRFLSFRRHEKTNQIHIHFHIFAFPPILQIPTTGSNRAPDAPRTAWRRSGRYVATQQAIRRDVAPTASGRSWKGKTCHIMLTDLTFNLMAIKLMAVKLGGREWDMREECTWFRTRNARDSGQGCTWFRTTIAFWRFFLYLCIVIHQERQMGN